ncbi:MAG: hypothetical protein ACRDZT_04770, partial [Acidimicrobiales bacterium]
LKVHLPGSTARVVAAALDGSFTYKMAEFPLHFVVLVTAVGRAGVALQAAGVGEPVNQALAEMLFRKLVSRAAKGAA